MSILSFPFAFCPPPVSGHHSFTGTSGVDENHQQLALLPRNVGSCSQGLSDALQLSRLNRSQAHLLSRDESSLTALQALILAYGSSPARLAVAGTGDQRGRCRRAALGHLELCPCSSVHRIDMKICSCCAMKKLGLCCRVLARQGLQEKVVGHMFCFRSLLLKPLVDQKLPLFLKLFSCPDFRDLLNKYR